MSKNYFVTIETYLRKYRLIAGNLQTR
jgi:hypothetical protein